MHCLSNLNADRPTFVTHLECGLDGDRYESDQIHRLSKAGRPLLVKYDMDAAAESVSKSDLHERPADM